MFITPDIYKLTIPLCDVYTCVFLIRTPEGNILYDTATYPEDMDRYIFPMLRELGAPHTVVLSHNHEDHAGGLARLLECYPEIQVCAGSEKLRPHRILSDGERLLGSITAHTLPGHTKDSIALLDGRTGTLLTADGLQLYGLYGEGEWGTNIRFIPQHLEALKKLKALEINALFTSHDFHPLGDHALGCAGVEAYLNDCAQAIYQLADFVKNHISMDDQAIANAYREETHLPPLSPLVIAAYRRTIANGDI